LALAGLFASARVIAAVWSVATAPLLLSTLTLIDASVDPPCR